MLSGRWKPVSIIRKGEARHLADKDYLWLREDKTYYSQATLRGRKRSGRWKLEDNKLMLINDSTQKTRVFNISELSGHNLKFSDSISFFSYIRLKN